MYKSEIKLRVRYGETDQMGYAYYGNYAQYFEVARVEALRSLGVSYKSLEESGVGLPVLDYSIKYLKPAYYDDELTILTIISEIPSAKINFKYETYNSENEKINIGETTLVFIDLKTGKPTRANDKLIEALQLFF